MLNPLTRLRETAGAWLAQGRIQESDRRARQLINSYVFLQEGLHDLEIQLAEQGWKRIGSGEQTEFDEQARRNIMDEARAFYIKNPLIGRGVDLTAAYVFGQGVTVQHEDSEVNEAVQAFWDAPRNRKAFTAQTSLVANDIYLTTMGNFYLSCFTDPNTGAVQVRMVPAPQICEIICNPEDGCEPWYYLRCWTEKRPGEMSVQRKAYYPALFYEPRSQPLQLGPEKIEVQVDAPMLHVRIGGLKDMQFGISQTYRAHDWARTDVKFLSDAASWFSSIARWAYKLTGLSGARGLAAAKDKLASTFGLNPAATAGPETSPAPTTGAVFLGAGDAKLEPLKIGGMGPDPEQGRTFRQYVATCFGFAETFFGNARVGNHATSKTLDRPFELVILLRQALWHEVISTLCRYVIEKAATSPAGRLKGRLLADIPGEGVELKANTETGQPVTTTVKVSFPPVLEHDITETVKAKVAAFTLDGKSPAPWVTAAGAEGTLLMVRELLAGLGVANPDEIMERLFPGGVVPESPEPPEMTAIAKAVEALSREIREAQGTQER